MKRAIFAFALVLATTIASSDSHDSRDPLEDLDVLLTQVMDPRSDEAQAFREVFILSLEVYQARLTDGGDNSPEHFFEIVEEVGATVGHQAKLALKAWRVLATLSERLGPVYERICSDLSLLECAVTPHHHHSHGDGMDAPHWEYHEGHDHRHRHAL